jgi:hypothetical protein
MFQLHFKRRSYVFFRFYYFSLRILSKTKEEPIMNRSRARASNVWTQASALEKAYLIHRQLQRRLVVYQGTVVLSSLTKYFSTYFSQSNLNIMTSTKIRMTEARIMPIKADAQVV